MRESFRARRGPATMDDAPSPDRRRASASTTAHRREAGRRRGTDPVRVLFDVGHPAHVHLFRHAIDALEARGHRTLVTSRDKECTQELLHAYGIDHRPLSTMGDGALGIAREWLTRERRLLGVARRFDPDVVVGVLNPAVAHVSSVLDCRSVVYNDSEASRVAGWLTHPFADVVCTPSGFGRSLGEKQVRYDGYHELAYLHPNRFDPDEVDLEAYGVDPNEPYSVVRFVSWGAHHDVAHHGLSPEAKRTLVGRLREHGEVYVTSESPLPPAFRRHRLPVPPDALHHLLAGADLYVGDSGTVATEAALLGTPAVRASSYAGSADDMSNFRELQNRYGLLYSTADEDDALDTVDRFLDDPETRARWQRRRTRLLAEKVDVTEHMVSLVVDEGCRS
ncbi:DUF354 domain-containing protein [Halomarina salina]|uniref:DUF354 domain-containing protein n=1 Tax=Halomarina salina TaxID=1872699 RepID=A0ABD5RIL7_9EURY|nr:DUF354 domain-containing protein [Halomarina salina]